VTTLSLTLIRARGLIVPSRSPLDPNPLQQLMFGKPDAPVERDFIDAREVDALLTALRPSVHALCEYAGGAESERLISAIATLRGVFEPEERPAPRLVTA